MTRGFTIVELLVSIAIFIIMTSLVVAKYGTFNQSTLLTDTAYDIALTVRTAQNYGLSVKNAGAFGAANNFSAPYGISFNTNPPATGNLCTGGNSNASQIVLFADTYSSTASPSDGIYNASPNCDIPVNVYGLTRGATISAICVGLGLQCLVGNSTTQLDVTFKRPDPDALIYANGTNIDSASGKPYSYAEITLRAVDGSTRIITVRQNGQVGVLK